MCLEAVGRKECKVNMIILKIKNNVGPGNQMFMYARAYTLAKKYNHKILILSEISNYSIRQNILQYYKLDKDVVRGIVKIDFIKNKYIYRLIRKFIFDVILKLPIFNQINNIASRSRIVEDEPILQSNKLYVVDGYFECHTYFDEYRDSLIRQYTPNYRLSREVSDLINNMEKCNSVSVHIRKGDFKLFGRLINDKYYEQSMKKIMHDLKNVHFFILTEDDLVINKYRKESNVTIVEIDTEHKYIDEWYVLTKCKYHIIANSTYSWWSSYISDYCDKFVVVPELKWYLEAEKDNNKEMYKNYYY